MYLNGVRVVVRTGAARKEQIGTIIHAWVEGRELIYEIRINETMTVVANHEDITPIVTKHVGKVDKNGIPVSEGDTVIYKIPGTQIFKSGVIVSLDMMGATPYALIKDFATAKTSKYIPLSTVLKSANMIKNIDRDYINSGFFGGESTTTDTQQTTYYSRINASIYTSDGIKDMLKSGDPK